MTYLIGGDITAKGNLLVRPLPPFITKQYVLCNGLSSYIHRILILPQPRYHCANQSHWSVRECTPQRTQSRYHERGESCSIALLGRGLKRYHSTFRARESWYMRIPLFAAHSLLNLRHSPTKMVQSITLWLRPFRSGRILSSIITSIRRTPTETPPRADMAKQSIIAPLSLSYWNPAASLSPRGRCIPPTCTGMYLFTCVHWLMC